jgi:hypothetical protein
MFNVWNIPAKSALDEPSVQFKLNGVCVDLYYFWCNGEGERWHFSLTLNHPLIGFSIHENGGKVVDVARLFRDMNDELEGANRVGFSEMDELVPAIVEALKPAYLKAPEHSASEDYYGE